MEKLPFSVVIISKNEEANIGRAIRSVLPVCSDIVVIDSGSSDQTKTIAQDLGARVFNYDWQGYSKTKNLGNHEAIHDYVFSLDADEAFSPEMCESLKEIFKGKPKYSMYQMNRLNHFAGKPITHGAWYPDWQFRLFSKNVHEWQESDEVHENLSGKAQTETGLVQGYLLHFTTADEAFYLSKMKKYAALFSAKRKSGGKSPSVLKAYASGSFRFFREYILERGFLDGKEGLKIARAHFIYTRDKYL